MTIGRRVRPFRRLRWRRRYAVLVLLPATFTLVSAASADDEQIHLTAAGQAAAKAAVVQRGDFGSATGWVGGMKKPDTSSVDDCPGFNPKQSDLVLIGSAESEWKHVGLQVMSHADVLQTPQMVRLDWQRSVLSPKVLGCLRAAVLKGLPTGVTFVSLRRVPFPAIAPYARMYRAVLDVKTNGTTIRVLGDFVLLARGRTEMELGMIAPYAAATVVEEAEIGLARMLLARAPA